MAFFTLFFVCLAARGALMADAPVGTPTSPECARAVLCSLVRYDFEIDFPPGSVNGALLNLLEAIRISKLPDVLVQTSPCSNHLEKCKDEVEVKVKSLNLAKSVQECEWDTYPYMLFHCQTIEGWPSDDAKKILKHHKMLECENHTVCYNPESWADFAKFRRQLPADWTERYQEAVKIYEEDQAFEKLKKATKDELIIIANGPPRDDDKKYQIVKSPYLDTAYQRKGWLMCDPGTYMSSYSFTMCLPDIPCGGRFRYIPHFTIAIECTNIMRRFINRQYFNNSINISSVSVHTYRVDNPNFFNSMVMVDTKKRLGGCSTLLVNYLLSKGYIDVGDERKPIGLPQYLTDDNIPNAEYLNLLRQANFKIYDSECKDGLVICGLQPATDKGFEFLEGFEGFEATSPDDCKLSSFVATVSVFCCRPQYFCSRSTRFVRERSVPPRDAGTLEIGDMKGFGISIGSEVSTSRTEGGSRSTTVAHTVSVEASAEALGMSVKAGYSYSHESTDEADWSRTVGDVKTKTGTISEDFNIHFGALNEFYQVKVECGVIDAWLKEIIPVIIVQGGTEFCNTEVKWMFQGIYNKTQTVVELPFGANFSQPTENQLYFPKSLYGEEFVGGAPYLPVYPNVTSTFLHRFSTDRQLSEPLEVLGGRNLTKVMEKYAGRQGKTNLTLKYKNGTSLPKEGGFLFQQVGICHHRRFPDKFQFIVYTDNLRVITFPSMDRGVPTDRFVKYGEYSNLKNRTKTYIRAKVRSGLSILNAPKELVIPKSALDKLPDMVTQLKAKFRQLGKSNATGVDWSRVVKNKWEMEHVIDSPSEVSVPAGTDIVFYVIQGHLNGWIYTLDLDQYEIIRDGCSVEAVGFHLGYGPTKKCDSKEFSCTQQEKFKRTEPEMVANPKSKGRNFNVEYAVGTVDSKNPSAKIPADYHEILRKSFGKLGVGPLTLNPWNKYTAKSWPSKVLEKQTKKIFVPSGLVAEAFQVVGVCGKYRVFTKMVYVRHLTYNEGLEGGVEFVNGTGPFKNAGFNFQEEDFLDD